MSKPKKPTRKPPSRGKGSGKAKDKSNGKANADLKVETPAVPPSVPAGDHFAAERREFIRVYCTENKDKELGFDHVKKHFEGKAVSEATLYNDAHALQRKSHPISASKRTFKFDEGKQRTVGLRSELQTSKKSKIADTAAKLIMPVVDSEAKFLKKELAYQSVKGDLTLKLEEFWEKKHRLLILDSGSTTAAIAHKIAGISTRDPARHLAGLRVLTNGDLVHLELNKKTCEHGLILLGGAERFDTGSIAGSLAERCLESWGLTADIAILGTTNLNRNGQWCCDHEDEASIKSRLLDRARIRCLAVDSDKLMRLGEPGSSFAFAPFSRFMIDIIITDPEIHAPNEKVESEELRLRFWKQAKQQGIFVATEFVTDIGSVAEL